MYSTEKCSIIKIMKIKDKVVIITGASQGIGRAAAKLLAKKGAKIVLAARSADALTELAKELPDSIAVPTDMRKPEDVKHLIEAAQKHYGRIDILINNAAQGMYGPVEKIEIENYKQVMDLNVYAPLLAMELVIPVMREQGPLEALEPAGMIMNISSRVSKNYFPYLAAYASTKDALNALSLTARAELAPDKIIVSVLHPKLTATDFGKNAIGGRPAMDSTGKPLPQGDTPEAVAEKIAELIESESAEAEM